MCESLEVCFDAHKVQCSTPTKRLKVLSEGIRPLLIGLNIQEDGAWFLERFVD